MDNKVLGEAVEVALTAYVNSRGSYEGEVPASSDDIRAALLAGVKVLLGEPVGWLAGGRFFDSESEADYEAKWTSSIVTAVYAPSLGEGDGR